MRSLDEKLRYIGAKVLDELLLHKEPVEVFIEQDLALAYSIVHVGAHVVATFDDRELAMFLGKPL